MSTNTILIALAIFPVLVLGFFVYRSDKFEKEPLRMLIKAFLFGCLSVVPAIFLETILSTLYSSFIGGFLPRAAEGFYTAFVVAGCSEELCKLLLLSWAVWRSSHFNEYFDGIVYSAFVALGFAAVENLEYVFMQSTFSAAIATGTMRAVLSVPGHFLFGVVMGYYFALARFQPQQRRANLFKAFCYPMLLHGTFDALLMIPEYMGEDGAMLQLVLFVVFILFDIRLWKVSMKRLRHMQKLSEAQYTDTSYSSSYDDNADTGDDSEPPTPPFSGFNWDV